MSDGRQPKPTPIPEPIVQQITQTLTEVGKDVKFIKEDLLPPVAKSAQETRDTVIELKGWRKDIQRRVETLEDDDHCTKEGQLDRHEEALKIQDGRLDEVDRETTQVSTKHAGLAKLFWWALGIIVVVGGSAVTYAVTAAAGGATQDAYIEQNKTAIKANKTAIKTIADGQTKVLEAIGTVQTTIETDAAPPIPPPGITIPDSQRQKLPRWKQRQLEQLLDEMGAQ